MRFTLLALFMTAVSVMADSCQCNTEKALGGGGYKWDTKNDECYVCNPNGKDLGQGKVNCKHTVSWGM